MPYLCTNPSIHPSINPTSHYLSISIHASIHPLRRETTKILSQNIYITVIFNKHKLVCDNTYLQEYKLVDSHI